MRFGLRSLGSRSLRGHWAQQNSARSRFKTTEGNSARSHFEVEKTGDNWTRCHLEATWLGKTRLEVISRPRGWPRISRPLNNLGNLSSACLARFGSGLGWLWSVCSNRLRSGFARLGLAWVGSQPAWVDKVLALLTSNPARACRGRVGARLGLHGSAWVGLMAAWVRLHPA